MDTAAIICIATRITGINRLLVKIHVWPDILIFDRV